MSLSDHPALEGLHEILPEAYVVGGSFAEKLPNPKDLSTEERRLVYEKASDEATSEVVKGLLCYVDPHSSTQLEKKPSGIRKWPDGYTGSLTDKGTITLGAIVYIDEIQSIGIDLEYNYENGRMLEYTVDENELPPPMDSNTSVLAAFSVKEAAYKAYHHLEERVLDFDEINLIWEGLSGPVYQGRAICPDSIELNIRYTHRGDWIISSALSH